MVRAMRCTYTARARRCALMGHTEIGVRHSVGRSPAGYINLADCMLVSVYIPTRNRLDLISRAIESVRAQTYGDIEIIVVDDGSTDGTREFLAAKSAEGVLRPIFLDKSMGACHARNQAIRSARGEYVTGLDDDDYFLPSRIADFVAALSSEGNKDVAGFFTPLRLLSDSRLTIRASEIATYEELKTRNCIGSQVFAKRAHFLDVGGFDVDMGIWQDWDLWARMSRRFGDFRRIESNTYVVDDLHDRGRISEKSEDVLRQALSRFQSKHDLNRRQLCATLAFLASYPQVNVSWRDVLVALQCFDARYSAKIIAISVGMRDVIRLIGAVRAGRS